MPIKFRKNVRLKKYDYSTNGYYFVTIVTYNRLPLLKPYKAAIEISIKNLPKFINGLSIDYFKIMDNHIHIIFVFKDCTRPLGRVVGAMKYSITKIIRAGLQSGDVTMGLPSCDTADSNPPATRQRRGRIIAGDVAAGLPSRDMTDSNPPATAQCRNMTDSNPPATAQCRNTADSNPPATWQWNYYEHIIRNEKSLEKIREYIDNNPLIEIINWQDLELKEERG